MAGHTLTSIGRHRRPRCSTFPVQPAEPEHGRAPCPDRDPGFAALGLVTPDFMIPNGFLPTDQRHRQLSPASIRCTYAALPTDSSKAIDHSGAPIQNLATNFAGASASVQPATGGRVRAGRRVCGGTRPRTAPATTSTSSTACWSCRCSPTKPCRALRVVRRRRPAYRQRHQVHRHARQVSRRPVPHVSVYRQADARSATTATSASRSRRRRPPIITLPNNRVSPIQPQVF